MNTCNNEKVWWAIWLSVNGQHFRELLPNSTHAQCIFMVPPSTSQDPSLAFPHIYEDSSTPQQNSTRGMKAYTLGKLLWERAVWKENAVQCILYSAVASTKYILQVYISFSLSVRWTPRTHTEFATGLDQECIGSRSTVEQRRLTRI